MRLDGISIGEGDASSLRLSTLATDLSFSLLVVPLDLVRRELVEEGGEVGGGGAEGFVQGREELPSEFFVRDGEAVDVPEETERLDDDVDLLADGVSDGRTTSDALVREGQRCGEWCSPEFACETQVGSERLCKVLGRVASVTDIPFELVDELHRVERDVELCIQELVIDSILVEGQLTLMTTLSSSFAPLIPSKSTSLIATSCLDSSTSISLSAALPSTFLLLKSCWNQ